MDYRRRRRRPPRTLKADPREIPLWSRFRSTPLGPEELVNALVGATGVEDALARMTKTDLEDLRLRLTELFSFAFDVDEELDKPRFEGTITQALVLLNGKLAVGGTSALPGTALGVLARGSASDADKVTALYLRTVSRKPRRGRARRRARLHRPRAAARRSARRRARPDAAERRQRQSQSEGQSQRKRQTAGRIRWESSQGIPRSRDPKVAALEDIMWALVNSSEFVFNH